MGGHLSYTPPRLYSTGRWPDPFYERLPRGKWATLRRSPTPYCNIRRVGDWIAYPLVVGIPFELIESEDYEINTGGLEARESTGGGWWEWFSFPCDIPPCGGMWIWHPGAGVTYYEVEKRLEIIVSDFPYAGGICRYAAYWTSTGTPGFELLRLPCHMADALSLRIRMDGADPTTFVAYLVSEDNSANRMPLQNVLMNPGNGYFFKLSFDEIIANMTSIPMFLVCECQHVLPTGTNTFRVNVNQRVSSQWERH